MASPYGPSISVATEIEGPYGEAKNGKILNFAKIYLGYSTEEDIDEKWTGGTTLSSFGENVVYGRVEFIDGNYETLTISKPEFKQFLFGPNVHIGSKQKLLKLRFRDG